ncbi:MAG: hypothetical protein HY744_21990 [Deltaproteobacteria bacterium]|nr:hypothetical protein [Deltaproteobacteria bacterium]
MEFSPRTARLRLQRATAARRCWRRRERDGPQQRHGTVRLARALVLAFVASAATHPAVWFVFPVLVPRSYWTMVAAAEAFAICFEAAYLWALGVRRPLLWSLAANAASASVGFLRYALLGA